MFNIYKVLFKRPHLIGIQVHVLCVTEYNCIRLGSVTYKGGACDPRQVSW